MGHIITDVGLTKAQLKNWYKEIVWKVKVACIILITSPVECHMSDPTISWLKRSWHELFEVLYSTGKWKAKRRILIWTLAVSDVCAILYSLTTIHLIARHHAVRKLM